LPTRSLLLGCALLSGVAFGACSTKELHPADARPKGSTGTFALAPGLKVDMLFVIDDSPGMALAQNNLIRNFPTFMTTLQSAPEGLPNIHVAVISSDMGAGDGSVPGCDASGGKQGIFQYTPRGTCTASGLEAGATYISDIGGTRNYTGMLPEVFTCIAALGETGCGFEHQFASILRALGADGRAAPQENQGFLRPDAYLAIIMITDEDDCSATPGVPVFDTSSNTNLMSQLGPPANFRCNEFGHLCNGGHPSRYAPNNDMTRMVSYTRCASNDTEGYLLSAADTANRIKGLKADPGQIIVASIQGPATSYTVNWKAPSTADTSCGAASCPWPVIAHSCTANDGSFGDPGVRTAEFVGQFGVNGVVLPICADSFAAPLDHIATLINASLQPPCITSPVARKANSQEYDCTVVSHTSNGVGGTVDATVASCTANGGWPPCWQLESAASCSGQVLKVSADPNLPPSTWITVSYDCAK